MPVFKKEDIDTILKNIKAGKNSPVYLVFGDRYLAQTIANSLVTALLPDPKNRANGEVVIDGDQEDPLHTLNLLRTYSLFGGSQVIRVMDSKLFLSKNVAKTVWDRAQQAFKNNKVKRAALLIGQIIALFDDDSMSIEELLQIDSTLWKQATGFTKPSDMEWLNHLDPNLLQPKKSDTGDIGEIYRQTLRDGIPDNHILILVAEAVDKRKRFYTFLKEFGVIIDVSVDSGFSSAAKKNQQAVIVNLIKKTLADFNKTMSHDDLNELVRRVGFHPVAAVMETEKLALFAGENPRITMEHIELLTGRTKEDALFELNEAITAKKVSKSIRTLVHLQEDGMHPLAIIAGLRNHIRKMLLAKSLHIQADLPKGRGLNYQLFQKNYLPALKDNFKPILTSLPTHPYALFNTLQQTTSFSLQQLKVILAHLLKAEYQLKSTTIPAPVVLDDFLFSIFLSPHIKREE